MSPHDDLVELSGELIATMRLSQVFECALRRLDVWAPDSDWILFHRTAPGRYDSWSGCGVGRALVERALRESCGADAGLDEAHLRSPGRARRGPAPLRWVRVPPRQRRSRREPDVVLAWQGDGLPEALLQRLAQLLSRAARSARLLERLLAQTTRDPLTRVLNRRGLRKALDRERSRAEREQSELSLLFVDVDGFKTFNDVYGHAAGDEVLQGLAARLRCQLRAMDRVGRFGGDEFVILLPGTPREGARRIARRLESRVAERPLQTLHGDFSVSVTIGVADLQEVPDGRQLMTLADRRMLAAKRLGSPAR